MGFTLSLCSLRDKDPELVNFYYNLFFSLLHLRIRFCPFVYLLFVRLDHVTSWTLKKLCFGGLHL